MIRIVELNRGPTLKESQLTNDMKDLAQKGNQSRINPNEGLPGMRTSTLDPWAFNLDTNFCLSRGHIRLRCIGWRCGSHAGGWHSGSKGFSVMQGTPPMPNPVPICRHQ